MSGSILQYESKVWNTADLLRGAGIKQSDSPKFMPQRPRLIAKMKDTGNAGIGHRFL